MTTAPTLPEPKPNTSVPLSLRVATIGFVTPIVLMLAGMAFWPERLGGPGVILTSNRRLLSTIIIELFFAATLGTWLWRKGWRPHRTATAPFAPRDLLRGVGLWLTAFLGYVISAVLWFFLAPEITAVAVAVQHVGQPALWIVLPLSVVNAVFEEFLWLGLGVAALHAAGVRMGVAAMISITLRVLVHAYQGPLALIAILPLGAIFTVYYVRTRRLWPVIVAHAIQDLLALALIALRASGRGV